MSEQILKTQLAAWEKKLCLRFLYTHWFQIIARHITPGKTLEIGAGIGKLKDHIPHIITLDIAKTPWTEMVADAQRLPFAGESLGNLVLFDVLHHLPNPKLFFAEAIRTLRPGGRILIMDPYISPLSWPVYRFLHPENVDMGCDPLGEDMLSSDTPFDSNQAIASLLFWRKLKHFVRAFPLLHVVKRERLALVAYPLSGGFGSPALLPQKAICTLARLEAKMSFLAPLMAFRTFIVLQKAL